MSLQNSKNEDLKEQTKLANATIVAVLAIVVVLFALHYKSSTFDEEVLRGIAARTGTSDVTGKVSQSGKWVLCFGRRNDSYVTATCYANTLPTIPAVKAFSDAEIEAEKFFRESYQANRIIETTASFK